MECPVCLESVQSPMEQCQHGHLVCGRCRARLTSCPVCRATYSAPDGAPEAVAEVERYRCRHGCGREVGLRRRREHEANCEMRRYPCPAPACAEQPRTYSHELLQLHFQCAHPSMVRQGCRQTFSVPLCLEQRQQWLVAALRELFHVRIVVDERACAVLAHVTYIGPERNAARYLYRVTVKGLRDELQLSYRRETHSDLESYFEVLSRQDCFCLSFDMAFNFLRIEDERGLCEQVSNEPLHLHLEIMDTKAGQEPDDSDS